MDDKFYRPQPNKLLVYIVRVHICICKCLRGYPNAFRKRKKETLEDRRIAHMCIQYASSFLKQIFIWLRPPSVLQNYLQFDCKNKFNEWSESFKKTKRNKKTEELQSLLY
jgi:hypothetical protein